MSCFQLKRNFCPLVGEQAAHGEEVFGSGENVEYDGKSHTSTREHRIHVGKTKRGTFMERTVR